MARVSISVSTVSKSGSLSSWLSLLYASGWPFMSDEQRDEMADDPARLAAH